MELNTFFRFVRTDLAFVYGGGESGLAYFLKTVCRRLDENPESDLSRLEESFIVESLVDAWQSARSKYGPDPERWDALAREAITRRRLGYQETLDGFPTLTPALAVSLPALTALDGGTIACQTSQAYTQYVPMHDPDLAESILPIGQSERPGDASRMSTLDLWGAGKLRPAPLTRSRVEALGVSRLALYGVAARCGDSCAGHCDR